MSYLIDHHLAVADPFGEGDSAAHLGLMMHLTGGFVFPWTDGGVALIRRELYPEPGVWEYCGIATSEETQIKNYPGFSHQADQAYQYAAVAFVGNGMVSQICDPIRLEFDSNGDLISPMMPAAPISLVAEPIAGGKFRIVWEYDPIGHGAFPKDFQVFEGSDAAGIDYQTPLTDSVTGLSAVPCTHERIYSFTTPAYGDRTPHVFAVRARNSGAVAEQNTTASRKKLARLTPPVSAPAPVRAYVRPYSRSG